MVADLLIPTRRVSGWDNALTRLLTREQATPFAWGEHDCATLALGVVRTLTGGDLAADVPAWSCAASARRSLQQAGATSAAQFFSARLEEIPVAAARRGDLVLPDEPLDALACPAVLTGAVAMSRDQARWLIMPRSLARRAFRVG